MRRAIYLNAIKREIKLKALIQGTIGLFLATIGLDTISREARFTLGWVNLLDGISIVPWPWVSSDIGSACQPPKNFGARCIHKKAGSLLPTIGDWKTSKWAIVEGQW